MSKIIREKNFYKVMLGIAIPIALQNIVNVSINLMDTFMIGKLGDMELAASAAANQFFFILTLLMFGLASGTNVLSAQFWGKGDAQAVRDCISTAHKIAIVVSLVFTAIAVFCPDFVLKIFTSDVRVIELGVKYLRIVCITYFFTALSATTFTIFRSIGSVNISVIVSVITLFTNVFWNWVFIFGKLGAPALGIEGAAIGTVIARIQEFIIIVIYLIFFEKKIRYRLKDFLRQNKEMLKSFALNVSPVVLNEFLWSTGASMLTVILGRMSSELLAANSIVTVIMQIVGVASMGVASATSVMIGNEIGKGDRERTQSMAVTLTIVSIVIGCFSCGLLHIIKPFFIAFYGNLLPLTLHYMSLLIDLMSIIVIFQTPTLTTMMGVLRGGGDAKFVLLNDIIFMWVVCIPLGLFTGLYLKLPVAVVYLIIKSDEIIKLVIALIRIGGGKWIKDVTK